MKRFALLFLWVATTGCGSDDEPGAAAGTAGTAGTGTPGTPAPVPVLDDFCTDGWCWESPKPHGNDLKAAWVDGDGVLWVVGAGPTIATWDGTSWAPRQAPDTFDALLSVWGDGAGQLWAGGAREGTLWHWDG